MYFILQFCGLKLMLVTFFSTWHWQFPWRYSAMGSGVPDSPNDVTHSPWCHSPWQGWLEGWTQLAASTRALPVASLTCWPQSRRASSIVAESLCFKTPRQSCKVFDGLALEGKWHLSDSMWERISWGSECWEVRLGHHLGSWLPF